MRWMKQAFLMVTALVMAVFVLEADIHAEIVDRIVAMVNNDIITLSELNTALKPYEDKIEEAGYSKDKKEKLLFKIRQDMLGRLIDEKLTDQEVGRLGIKVSDQEVDAAIERIKSSQLMTQEDLEKALEKDGLSLDAYREKIRREIMRPKLINYSVKSKIIITDEDVKAYYDAHQDQYGGEKKFHLSNILILCDPHASQEIKENKLAAITEIKNLLDQGESFHEVARSYSEAPNAGDGGELGLFTLDVLSDQLRKTVLSLEEGTYTDVMETGQGYQIFFLDRIETTPGKKLEEVSETISSQLYEKRVEKRFKSWIDSLRENSHIKTTL